MALVHGDARQHLAALAQRADERPEVVYLDPMFPPRTKTALVKKDIALLQGLLGSAQDFPALLAAALACARHRVVVKRPGSKVEESGPRPTFVVPGKSAHFEVYVNSSFSSTR
jgi:16S rRNA (guanine1516-N2)-methyltransferase